MEARQGVKFPAKQNGMWITKTINYICAAATANVVAASMCLAQDHGKLCVSEQLSLIESLDSSIALDILKDTPQESSRNLFQCRINGIKYSTLRKAWPSATTPWDIKYEYEPSPYISRNISDVISSAYDKLVDEIDWATPLTVDLFVIDSDSSIPDPNFSQVRQLCATHGRIGKVGAFSSETTIVICLPYSEKISTESIARLSSVVRHELFHIAQYQLLSAPARTRDPELRRSSWGPEWLVEGTAQYYALAFPEQCPKDSIAALSTSLMKFHLDLHDLESGWDMYENSDLANAYDLSLLAACELRANSGSSSFSFFYETIGAGEGWHTAFRKAFDMDVKTFYLRFSEGLPL